MIIVLFGQPHSGKTTLAKELGESFDPDTTHYIDGDQLRYIFQNKDFSREGRLKNLQKASDIAAYLNWTGKDVLVSVVYPYKEARDYLNSLSSDVKWVYLYYKEERGRENFHVKDFEFPFLEEKVLQLNTSDKSVEECLKQINSYINE
jgi:adenylylsulfate kinase-like enzyme